MNHIKSEAIWRKSEVSSSNLHQVVCANPVEYFHLSEGVLNFQMILLRTKQS